VDEAVVSEALKRIAGATEGRPAMADVDAALERARSQVEELAALAAELQSTLPEQIGETIREGLRAEAAPMSRRVNELRGLSNQMIRRLERLEGDITAERYSRVDDLALLVDLITASWRSVEQRLSHIEHELSAQHATVHPLERREAAG
jgi:septation ring formation regulator EzrA